LLHLEIKIINVVVSGTVVVEEVIAVLLLFFIFLRATLVDPVE